MARSLLNKKKQANKLSILEESELLGALTSDEVSRSNYKQQIRKKLRKKFDIQSQ